MNHPTLNIAAPAVVRSYKVRDWDKHFECRQSREVKELRWVPVPNNHDGEGFRYVMNEPDGLAIYGAWQLILQVASKCHPRGTLVRDDGTPMSARMIAIKSGWNLEKDIQRALDFCSLPEVGWIECETLDLSNKSAPSASHRQPTDSAVPSHRQRGGQEGRKEGTPEEGGGGVVAVADQPEPTDRANQADHMPQSRKPEHRTLNTESREHDSPHNPHADRIEPKLRARAVSVVRVMYALQGDSDTTREPLNEELDAVLQAFDRGFSERELVAVAKLVKGAWRDRPDMMVHFTPRTVFKLEKLRSQINIARQHGYLSAPKQSHPNAPPRAYAAEKLSAEEQAKVDGLAKELAEKFGGKKTEGK